MFTRILYSALLLICINTYASDLKLEVLSDPIPITDFALTDQNGEPFDKTQLLGNWSMIFIGFTSCSDVCPFTLVQLESLRAELGLRVMPEDLPQIVFVAVDPERDKAMLKPYINHFHGEFIGLTGEPKEIDKLVSGIDGFYRLNKKPGKPNYDVRHSAAIAVVNPQGQTLAQIYPPFDTKEASFELFKLMKGVDDDA